MNFNNSHKVPYLLYFIIFLFLYISLSLFTFPDALDITRYYENVAYSVQSDIKLIDYIKHLLDSTIDFVYFSSLFIAYKLGISLNIITTIYLSMYYICCLELFRLNNNLIQTKKLIIFYALMCAPFIWVLEISRNLAAISFFYIAVIFFLRKLKKVGLVFAIVSIFTHISMITYIPIVCVAYLLSKKTYSINHKYIAFIFVIMSIIGYLLPGKIIDVMTLLSEGSETRYSYYATYDNINPLLNTIIGYGDKMPMFFIFIYSIIIVVKNKKHDFFFWMLFMLTTMLSFALFSSLLLTNRIIMLMPLFVVGNLCSIPKAQSRLLYSLSIIGAICVFANFYSYRTAFSF